MSHSHGHSHENMVPTGAIVFAGVLVLSAFAMVASVRSHLLPAAPTQSELRNEKHVPAVAERLLHFADTPDGFVQVTDARSGAVVARIGQEGSGFIRGVMRGLARERRMHHLDASQPFRLTLWGDTSLTLVDTATGRIIELNGFGHTNRGAFYRLLVPGATI